MNGCLDKWITAAGGGAPAFSPCERARFVAIPTVLTIGQGTRLNAADPGPVKLWRMKSFAVILCLLAAQMTTGWAAAELVDEPQILAGTEARILQNRTAPLTIQVLDAGDKPLANQKVTLKHAGHLFHFGAGFDRGLLPRPNKNEADRRHRENFLKIFNYATLHLYWGSYEPTQGGDKHAELLQSAQWLHDQGLVARGHPLFWNHLQTVPRWVEAQATNWNSLSQLMDVRVEQLAKTVLPELEDADVFNELVQWNRFTNAFKYMTDSSKVEVVTHYLKEFRRLSPNLKLVINDYDTAPSYHQLLKTLIEAGAPVDIIGQQCHMHDGPWSVTKTWEVLNRLSQLKRPILMSELSVLSGPKRQMDWYNNVPGWNTDPENEQKQADFLEQWYRLVYSHSNTVGIVVWNYTDRRAWLGAPVGFLRKDGTPKPAFERLDALINKQWRTNGEFTTDERGRVMVPQAYEGWYEAKCGLLTVRKKHSAAAPLKCLLNLP